VVVDGEAVLHDHARRALHVLNATATAVWSTLDGRPLDDVVAALVARYPNDAPDVAHDVRATVEELAGLGVLVR
jgi:hypothetical protein